MRKIGGNWWKEWGPKSLVLANDKYESTKDMSTTTTTNFLVTQTKFMTTQLKLPKISTTIVEGHVH